MKKKKIIAVMTAFILGIIGLTEYKKIETIHASQTLSDTAVRFHVLANSDSKEDQQLKMKVKQNVVNYIYQNTSDFDSVEETKRFITKNDNMIKNIAINTIQEQGYNYSIDTYLGMQNFPEKTYGDIVFPKGNYTSYTITIGNGKGHNWWCVLYPPLCFVDASTGIVPDSSKEMIQETMDHNEYQTIVKYRFKYLTFLNKFLD